MTTQTSGQILKELIGDILHLLTSYASRADVDPRTARVLRVSLEQLASRSKQRRSQSFRTKYGRSRATKFDLIGFLPSIFLERDRFPTNTDISNFTRRYLGLDIPQPEKKSRPDLVGRIVAEIYVMEPSKLENFLRGVEPLMGRLKEGKVSDFFVEWDEVIRNLEFRH